MARKKKESVELAAEEIREELALIGADERAWEATLKQWRATELSGFANGIREQIIERGDTPSILFR